MIDHLYLTVDSGYKRSLVPTSKKKKICLHEAHNNDLIERLSVADKQINEHKTIDKAAASI